MFKSLPVYGGPYGPRRAGQRLEEKQRTESRVPRPGIHAALPELPPAGRIQSHASGLARFLRERSPSVTRLALAPKDVNLSGKA